MLAPKLSPLADAQIAGVQLWGRPQFRQGGRPNALPRGVQGAIGAAEPLVDEAQKDGVSEQDPGTTSGDLHQVSHRICCSRMIEF